MNTHNQERVRQPVTVEVAQSEEDGMADFNINPKFAQALQQARAADDFEREKTETLLEISSILGISTGHNTPERLVQRLSAIVRKLQAFEVATDQEIR